MISKWVNCFLVAAAMAPALASAERYNLQTPQSIIAREIYDLHTLIMWIIVGIFVVVFGAMIYSIIKHRQAAGLKAAPFHANVMVEIAWTIVPFLILIGMAYPATKTVISMKAVSSPEMTVMAIDDEWKRGTTIGRKAFFYAAASPCRASRSMINPVRVWSNPVFIEA